MSAEAKSPAGVLWVACALALSGSGASSTKERPAIDSFTARPPVVSPGQSSTLAWSVTGAEAVSLDQGLGSVVSAGSRTVQPSATTTYTITASNKAGGATATVTVNVTLPGSFALTANLQFGRKAPAAAVLAGGRVFIVSGSNPTVVDPGFAEIYDPTGGYEGSGTFFETYRMNHTRKAATAAVLQNGKVL